MSEFVDIFGLITRYNEVAPKNMKELKEFGKNCRKLGAKDLADWIEQWIDDMEYHIMREFSND